MQNNEQIAREQGEARKEAGMLRAKTRKRVPILRGRITLIEALLSSADGHATTDDACDDLFAQYADSGKWRGAIPKPLANAGIIERVGYTPSMRPSRHRTPISLWRLLDRDAAVAERTRLRVELYMSEQGVDRTTAAKAVLQATITELEQRDGGPQA